MLWIETIAVLFSMAVLFSTAIFSVRTGLSFKKTFSYFRNNAEPKAVSLMNGSQILQNRAFDLIGHLDTLQRRFQMATNSLRKLSVLTMAIGDAWTKASKILNYIGL